MLTFVVESSLRRSKPLSLSLPAASMLNEAACKFLVRSQVIWIKHRNGGPCHQQWKPRCGRVSKCKILDAAGIIWQALSSIFYRQCRDSVLLLQLDDKCAYWNHCGMYYHLKIQPTSKRILKQHAHQYIHYIGLNKWKGWLPALRQPCTLFNLTQ